MQRFGLHGPEIPERIGRYFLLVHHFPDAPDVMRTAQIEFRGNRAVHLAVVADKAAPQSVVESKAVSLERI